MKICPYCHAPFVEYAEQSGEIKFLCSCTTEQEIAHRQDEQKSKRKINENSNLRGKRF